MNRESYEKLMEILNDYKTIPRQIERKQKLLEIKLCDPSIHALRGFSAFIQKENEIAYLNRKYELLKELLSKVDEEDRDLLALIMNGRNIFTIMTMLGISYQAISAKVDYYADKLTKEINYKKIYGIEESKNGREKEL